MKQKSLSVASIIFIAITMIIASCSKGPAGATGATGATGAAGPAGAAGATGATGTANVIYSPWLNVKFTGNDSTGWFAQVPAPLLTDSIINQGAIKVYFNYGSDSTGNELVMPLPIFDLYLTGDVINDYFEPQLIILAATIDESSYTSNSYNYYQYRYILIPGGTTTLPTSVNGSKGSINWNDYNQVKAYLGLKD